ncbi:MAG: helicase-exonuclease AddAB subunit AddA [Clostridia bacterium]|nr:helicase-exonuclease AddAB subunit AddA [Clostridia bacterium]
MDWTNDQKKAIEARKGTLLVSAAAGSGKTAVLVERVIRRICDSEKPCGVENLLIVTFTKAAASQMKEKIEAAISKKIAENPSDRRLRRQQLMLPCANICTIDSFCINLVRENFHALGIAPDFGMLDESRLDILRAQAVNTVVGELYKNPTENFMRLTNLISDNRDDKKLIDAILRLHNLSQAYPFPENWLRSLVAEFTAPREISESPWGRILLEHMAGTVESCIGGIDHCLYLLADEPELEAKYAETYYAEKEMLARFVDAIKTENWDGVSDAYSRVVFGRIPTAPKGYVSEVKDICQNIRNAYKKELKDMGRFLCISSDEHREDVEALAPVVTELIEAVITFANEFDRLKLAENGADFSDTLHMALRLLVEQNENGCTRTPLANQLSENYAEILVDEYQDVNLAQDMIFSALSKEENNLFMVGDVKQSIYRFRQAMPEIFLSRRDRMDEYENENYPAKVTLGKNFRSRKGVTGIVNFIFESVMSRDAGGLDYDCHERLEAGASYPEKAGADTEFILFETPKDDFLKTQARYVADYIQNAVATGMPLSAGDGFRPAEYKDFCILVRSVKNSSREFVDELNSRGIPVSCEAGGGLLNTPEIMFLTSLLKVIDNPVNDIPLTAVMLSPVFGFTPDDLAVMRADRKKGSVYSCVVFAAENGDMRAAEFIGRLREMRRIAATVRVGELVRRLIEETGYAAAVCAMKNSSARRTNLNLFIDLANKFEANGRRGVSGFVGYLDNISKSGGDISGSSSKSEVADAVKIMTIHKSKGLEFPVCFVAACEKTYNDFFNRDDLIIAGESGIGIKNNTGVAKYDTLPRLAAKTETLKAEHSEELRVLYVALTRAKEKLILLSSCADCTKTLTGAASNLRQSERVDPFTVIGFSSYSECVLTALLRHPDAHELRAVAGISQRLNLPCETPLSARIIRDYESETVEVEAEKFLPDEEILAEIRRRLSYEYPFSALNGVVAKQIASNLDVGEVNSEFFASRRPAFMSKDKLTPAQRGTATHRFMQFADYVAAGKDASAELSRLVADGMLTHAEANAVDIKAISGFFSTPLAKRILDSEKLFKEYEFTFGIPVRELYPEISEDIAGDEKVIIEGVADCAFIENGELVIVDYKTDRVTDAQELKTLYSAQLGIYRRCLEQVIGLPVKETLIYSFRLGETIEI